MIPGLRGSCARTSKRSWWRFASFLSPCRRGPFWLTLLLAVALASCGGNSEGTAGDSSPSVSASASAQPTPQLAGRLMYSRFEEASHTFISTHIADPNGSNERELPLPGPEGGGRWSHSGDEIAVMTILPDERVGTAIISPEGSVQQILEIPDKSLNLVCTVWSPDDSRIACEGWDDMDPSRSGIYTIRASDGGDLQRLTETPEGAVDLPGDYSPDGTHLIFKRAGDEQSGPLLTLDLKDGSLKQFSRTEVEDPGRFSPDGKSVLSSDGTRVIIMDLKGQPVRYIEKDGSHLFGPVWSPDGDWIAFSGGAAGPSADIFISRPDGSDQRQITSTDANEITVEWGPN